MVPMSLADVLYAVVVAVVGRQEPVGIVAVQTDSAGEAKKGSPDPGARTRMGVAG